MKPINSREKSKQLWQFVFIVFGLAVIPAALIFFSYYKVPEKISETEERKLIEYSNFEHAQKVILRKMIEVDSNINKFADAATENPKILENNIVLGLSDLGKMDTSIRMVNLVGKGYEHHYSHVNELRKAQDELKNAIEKLQAAETENKTLKESMRAPNMANMPMQMPPPAQ